MDWKNNNFDLIRIMAAILVVFSHSFAITSGNNDNEPLYMISNGQTTLGHVGVMTFFVISGYLITMSYLRHPSVILFVKSRLLRIVPALVIVVIMTMFLGSIATTLDTRDYFTNTDTYKYLLSIFIFPIQFELPGVFQLNPLGNEVNGSLWTLEWEVVCYFIVLALGTIKLLNLKNVLVIYMIFFLLSFFDFPNYNFDLFACFLSGMFVYMYKDKIRFSKFYLMTALTCLMVGIVFGNFNSIFSLFGTYIIMYASFRKERVININKYGDLSYGIYIYSFPIQQVLTQYFHLNSLGNFIYSLPIIILCSYLSWRFVEGKALSLKNKKIVNIRGALLSNRI
ncbi:MULTISPECIES: acyltransferase family protein [Bacillus]|uniref:acyltransferase family protein n=1 Tax=Bacillus TaxID=1386 RepID=UPI001BB3FE51|nr:MULTISPECIES: acyltransferase [Bacillus]